MTTRRFVEYRLTLKRERVLLVADVVGSFVDASRVAGEWFASRELCTESVLMIGLDGRNRVIGLVEVARGGMHGAAVTAPDVLRPVLVMGASAFILAHNHPSGDPTPSPEDHVMTRALASAAAIVGTPLLDHIVWTPSGTCSCLEEP